MGKEIKISNGVLRVIVLVLVGLGVVSSLINIFPTVFQGIFIVAVFFSIVQNLVFIKFHLTGKASSLVREIFDKTRTLSKDMEILRIMALLGTVIERPFVTNAETVLNYQFVFYAIILNLATQALVKLTSDRAALRNPESAVYIARMPVDEKLEEAKGLEEELVVGLKTKLTDVSDKDLREILNVLTEGEDIYKSVHKLYLLRKNSR